MYGWIWRHLPGNTLLRTLLAMVLMVLVLYVLFEYFFPWLDPRLPFNNVTPEGTE
jgi:hypothetical protein